jgi:biopolymer transport protein ExbD
MAASVGDDDDDVIAEINIVPFVDIVLVLLIIFIVTSATIVRASLSVDLPKAASGGSVVESTLNIVYSAERILFLNGTTTAREQLAQIVRQEVLKEPKTQAVISADQSLPYGEVVGIIDLVKKNGIASFALNIERKVD